MGNMFTAQRYWRCSMQVGDLVFMHNVEDLGIIVNIIVNEKSVDKEPQYQVKWFYTLADDFKGYKGAGNWYFEHHIGSVNKYLAAR